MVKREGASAPRGASTKGQKAGVVLHFKDAGDGHFTIVHGKAHLGGIREPNRTFVMVDTEDGGIKIADAGTQEDLAVQELAEKNDRLALRTGEGLRSRQGAEGDTPA